MKLDAAPAARNAPRDNKFEGASRDQRPRGGSFTSAPAPASGSAMASAFAKLHALKKQ